MEVAIQAIPQTLTDQMIEEASFVDEEIQQVNEVYKHVKNELTAVARMVMRGTRMLMPKKLRAQTLVCTQECHQWIVRTKQRLRETVWWLLRN